MADLIQFDAQSGARISRAVRTVEAIFPRARPLTYSPVFFERVRRGQIARIGTISGSWAKNTNKTVTRIKGDGTAIIPTQTFQARNHFADITVDCGTKKVACVKIDGTWVLVADEC